jgi:hypothetical protein
MQTRKRKLIRVGTSIVESYGKARNWTCFSHEDGDVVNFDPAHPLVFDPREFPEGTTVVLYKPKNWGKHVKKI